MKFRDLKSLVRDDLFRYGGVSGLRNFLVNYFLAPGFRYSFWLRVCNYCSKHPVLKHGTFQFVLLVLLRCSYKFGISIPYHTEIGQGLYIGHFGGIVVNGYARIGKNCNLSHGVTLGQANRGKRKGYPIIGDNVYIGPGAKIVGAVRVGNCAAVGANCVVTDDVPENGVVVGVPGKIVSHAGSVGYVEFTV